MQRVPFAGLLRFALATLIWLGPGFASLTAGGLLDAGEVSAATCPTVPNTPSFTFAYGPVQLDGTGAQVGAVVEAVSPRDDVVGCFEVTDSGAYGAMHIYGEDSSVSPTIPGMREGETVVFRVDGALASASPELAWHNDRDLHQVDLEAQTLAPLDGPSDLSATATSQTEMALSWQDNAVDESAYHVERSADGGYTWATAGAVGAGFTSFGDQGLACSTTYTYRVRAYREADSSYSPYSDSASDTTQPCAANILDVAISQSADDAEEELFSGNISLSSPDLELGEESESQIVGLRFQNLEIPFAASIARAYVVFRADETDSGATSLTFRGQASDSAPAFGTSAGNLTGRPTTSASVAWDDVPPWESVHAAYQSPDLAPIIQEIVGRAGWSASNDLVLLITGSGKRVAESYNGEPDLAASLHLEYDGGLVCHSLDVAVDPPGAGSVDASPAPNCSAGQYSQDTDVQLTAQSGAGYRFDHWSGDLAGSTNPETILMDADRSVTAHFLVQSIGPLVYDSHILDDDQQGDSDGNGDGIANCGESIELDLDLTNQGTTALMGISATLSTSDPYVTWLFGPTNSFPDIGPGVTATSSGDYDLQIDAAAPNGHRITFDLQASADSGGPWSDSFELDVACSSGGGSVDVAVSQSTDDAEERLTDGDVALKGVDLELGVDSVAQIVGLRFQNVEIPQGANITSASLVFTADETKTGDTDLVLRGQASDDTVTFESNDNDVSSRPRTTAAVPWTNVAPWTTVHATYASPDLSPIIQEIVSRAGWSSGNSLVILIEGTGRRTAEAYNGEPDMAPRLLVEYGSGQPPTCYTLSLGHTGSGGDPLPSPANSPGCTGGQYVAGQAIELSASPASGWAVASWSGTDNDGSTATTNQVTMPAANHSAGVDYVEPQVDCYTLSLSHSGSGSDPFPSPTNSAGCAAGQYVAGQTVDLSASPASGWAVASWSGTMNDGSTATTNQITMPGGDKAAAVNYVEAPPGDSLAIRVSASKDDAEEKLIDNDMALKSVDLELGEDSELQIVGLRFQNVDIPQGASISSASIVFSADESHDGTTDLLFRGQDSDDTVEFDNDDGNLSSRPQTAASVAWNNVVPWNTVHATYPSPDLSPIIQEIVNRPGWTAGNSLVILVEGSGKRTAESYNGEPDMAPQLLVEYGSGQPPTCYALTTSLDPASGGSISASPPPNCAGGLYTEGTQVQLTAQAAAGYGFDHWTGDLSGSANPQSLTMDGDRTATAHFVASEVGPLVYDGHTVDDDQQDDSDGNNDGIVNCGERIEVYVDLRNQGTTALTSVSATLSVSDPYATWLNTPTSAYPDLPGGGAGSNSNDFDLSIDAGAPHGHTVTLSLQATAANGGPWSDSFDLQIICGGGSSQNLEATVSERAGDAEEDLSDGSVALAGWDLELGEDKEPQAVGLHFQNIAIPQGATITSAIIEFTADEVHDGDTDLLFHGQAADNAPAFDDNDGDVSGRPVTAASVAWNNVPAWTAAHDTYQSPNLAPILQEIVNRGGWASGNSLALIITGSGKRVAESYDGEQDLAPRLLVTYTSP